MQNRDVVGRMQSRTPNVQTIPRDCSNCRGHVSNGSTCDANNPPVCDGWQPRGRDVFQPGQREIKQAQERIQDVTERSMAGLRARISELEEQLGEAEAQRGAAVAEAQARTADAVALTTASTQASKELAAIEKHLAPMLAPLGIFLGPKGTHLTSVAVREIPRTVLADLADANAKLAGTKAQLLWCRDDLAAWDREQQARCKACKARLAAEKAASAPIDLGARAAKRTNEQARADAQAKKARERALVDRLSAEKKASEDLRREQRQQQQAAAQTVQTYAFMLQEADRKSQDDQRLLVQTRNALVALQEEVGSQRRRARATLAALRAGKSADEVTAALLGMSAEQDQPTPAQEG